MVEGVDCCCGRESTAATVPATAPDTTADIKLCLAIIIHVNLAITHVIIATIPQILHDL